MNKTVRKYWEEQPLACIMILALLFRLLAVFFAKGWGMVDDHFIVIESSGSWTDGYDYNDWLPGSNLNKGPTGHSFFYPGLHYLLFTFLNWAGITGPQDKMFIVRLIHASLSLITVYYGYRITETLDGKKSARLAGLLLAVFWFMPWMSVRNLVEMASIPFLVLGYWVTFRPPATLKPFFSFFLAGLFFGLAFNIRPQTLFFPVGLSLVLLFQKRWKEIVAVSIGSLLVVALIQGGIDFFIWGKPFAEMVAYVNVCITERNDYISLPWYNYFLTLSGLLIPPISLFLLFGFIREWKRVLIVFLPVLLFFIFHSYFPNKQERFILPLIPFLIITGTIGWRSFVDKSGFWGRNKRLMTICWSFFWVINTVLLFAFSLTYSKKARVEAMSYLSKYPYIETFAVLDSRNEPELMPKFYLGQWPRCFSETSKNPCVDSVLHLAARSKTTPPAFILFTTDRDIRPMVDKARTFFPYLVYETTIDPGNMDHFIHWLNPINKNRRIIIYRNTAVIPQKIE